MKILLAEDDMDLSKGLVELLKRNHYTVDAVYDGQEALDYIVSGNYDGMILDIMMPKMDGLSVIKEMRKNKIYTPVILLTAKSEIDDKVCGLDAGADDYLTKPFAVKEFLARVRAIIRRKEIQTDIQYQFGNVFLNPATFELFTEYSSVKLGNKEFQVMEMLMTNPNQLISTEKFMEKIWGYDSQSEITVVWTNISYLRKKLTMIRANIEIKANRGAGYSMEEIK